MEHITETKARSLVKSLVWRTVAIINGFVTAFIFLFDVEKSIKISIVANLVGFILYYMHERLWDRIKWGRGYR